MCFWVSGGKSADIKEDFQSRRVVMFPEYERKHGICQNQDL
jgi:hypothetical protein